MFGQRLSATLALIALASLTACGGGGGGDSGGSTTNPGGVVTNPGTVTDPVVTEPVNSGSTIVTTAPTAPVYTAASEEAKAFALLDSERARCGFGHLTQSTQLDAAAYAHASYQLVNNLDSHFENQSQYPTGFTGATAADRATAKGYTGIGGIADEYSYLNSSVKAGAGEQYLRELLNAPYHQNGLLSGYRDVGFAVVSNTDVGSASPATFLQVNLAYKATAGTQKLGSQDVVSYPCEGTTGVNRRLRNETPNPVPGRDLLADPLGTTMSVMIQEGRTLKLTSATMIKVSTGGAIVLRTPISSDNDPYKGCTSGCMPSHAGYITADSPLEANTEYQVTYAGTNNGEAFSRTVKWTTGTGG